MPEERVIIQEIKIYTYLEPDDSGRYFGMNVSDDMRQCELLGRLEGAKQLVIQEWVR